MSRATGTGPHRGAGGTGNGGDRADDSAFASLGAELSPDEFGRVARLLYRICGINLQMGKEQLVKARLWKRVRNSGLSSFDEYLDLVESPAGAGELKIMVDVLTTNQTSFFREAQHFDYLRGQLPFMARLTNRLRIWCAGCSSGEEPYSLVMSLLEARAPSLFSEIAVLATDISARMLEQGRSATYDLADVVDLPDGLRRRYFVSRSVGGEQKYQVADGVRSYIRFARLNLMDSWPMQGPFDIIFCRNVMIYFDKDTQLTLVDRFRNILTPQGHLFIGHSESLAGRAEGFTYVMPAAYRKESKVSRHIA